MDHFQIPLTLSECQKWLQCEKQALNKIIKDSVVTREMELREKIQDLQLQADEAAKDKVQALRQLVRAEQLKQLYCKIQRLRRTKKGSLYKLEVPIDASENPKAIALDSSKWICHGEAMEEDHLLYHLLD